MTRMKIFGALAALVIIIGGIVALPHLRRGKAEAATSKLEAVSLNKYGLEIIDDKNPAFAKLMAGNNSDPVTAFSVFVVNNSNKALASCSLKWEITLADGQTANQFQTKMGTFEIVADDKGAHLAEGIAAGGNLLFSLTNSSGSGSQSHGFNMGGGTPGSQSHGFVTGGGTPDITAQLSDSVKGTVSIDGALFTDGTYVGPDVNNNFDMFKGQIEAKRELAGEVNQLMNSGATPEDIKNYLKKIQATQSNDVKLTAGESSRYAFGKWNRERSYAGRLLLIKEKKGDQAVLELIQADLAAPQINFRKIAEN